MATRLKGSLQIDALRNSLCDLCRRHEILRTSFALTDNEPFQRVDSLDNLELDHVDLSEVTGTRREAQLRKIVELEGRRPFDLSQNPLWRATLVRLDENEHALLLTLHHALCDGWSLEVLGRELAVLYEAQCAGTASPLEPLPIQYADFAVWQREQLNSEAFEPQVDYWRKRLADAPAVSTLPFDRPRPSKMSHRGGQHALVLDEPLVGRLRTVSREGEATLFMTLLAAFNSLCSRLALQQDFVIGVPITGRNCSEVEGLIGLFVNTLVIRTDLTGNPTFRELLDRVRGRTVEAYANPDVPFERLVQELQPERDLNRSPLFQIAFNMLPSSGEPAKFLGLDSHPISLPEAETKVDLSVFVSDQNNQVQFSVLYSTDLFDEPTVRQFFEQYRQILEVVAANPDQLLSELSLAGGDHQSELVESFNEALE